MSETAHNADVQVDSTMTDDEDEEDAPVWGECEKTAARCADRPNCQCETCRKFWDYQGTEE